MEQLLIFGKAIGKDLLALDHTLGVGVHEAFRAGFKEAIGDVPCGEQHDRAPDRRAQPGGMPGRLTRFNGSDGRGRHKEKFERRELLVHEPQGFRQAGIAHRIK